MIASRIVTGSYGITKVRTARRSTGGVAMMLISRTPDSASCRVRGIGVAVSVSTCTSAFSCFSFSFCATPKCCSSSTISEAEMGETHILGEQRVRADDDVDPAVGEFRLDLLRLLGGDQPRQLRDAQRQPGKALGEAAVMLPRQQGRRHDHRDLRAGHRRDKGGAQRHLGLAEPDIAADQPVHRLARGHVGERVLDRAAAGPRSRDRGSGRRIPRRSPRAAAHVSPGRSWRSAATRISSPAISRMRCLTRALRDCQATPPSRSSCAPASSEPKRDSTSMFSTGTNSLSSPA